MDHSAAGEHDALSTAVAGTDGDHRWVGGVVPVSRGPDVPGFRAGAGRSDRRDGAAVLPGALGGPWTWDRWNSSPAFPTTPGAVQAVLAGVLLAAGAARGRQPAASGSRGRRSAAQRRLPGDGTSVVAVGTLRGRCHRPAGPRNALLRRLVVGHRAGAGRGCVCARACAWAGIRHGNRQRRRYRRKFRRRHGC